MVESYKGDALSRKELLTEHYRPMRETQVECKKINTDLYVKYAHVSAAYQLAIDEMKNAFAKGEPRLTREQEIFLEAFAKSPVTALDDSSVLEKRLEECKTKLFRQYSELAIATGTYEKFISIAQARDNQINSLNAQRTQQRDATMRDIDTSKLSNVMHTVLRYPADMGSGNESILNRLEEIANPTVQIYADFSKNEQKISAVDEKLFVDLHAIFAAEISKRYERSWISRLFF
jgi:hypothetical protein